MPLTLNDQDINVMWSHKLNAPEICAYIWTDRCFPITVFEKLQQLTDTVLEEFGTMPSEIFNLMLQFYPALILI